MYRTRFSISAWTFLNEVLDLKDFIKDPVRTLSLGQRMRADIAASLLHNPKVLFLDEPTIGLDVSVKDNIRRAITQINQEEETTILLTTHDLSDIEQLCDRIFMIDKGQEIFDGTVSQLKGDLWQDEDSLLRSDARSKVISSLIMKAYLIYPLIDKEIT